MTALVAFRGRPSGAQLADLREQILDVEEEIGVMRDEALTLCGFALPEARRLHMVMANLDSRFHEAEQIAAALVHRLERYERRFQPEPDAPIADELAWAA